MEGRNVATEAAFEREEEAGLLRGGESEETLFNWRERERERRGVKKR